MKFVLASKNKGKLKEISKILGKLNIEVCLESDLGIDIDVDETGTTFEENSLLKAKAVMKATNMPTIADDSGLCVDALNGEPGVYSARYGDKSLDDEGRCKLVLTKMPKDKSRHAQFVCVITCCFPNGDMIQSRGVCEGEIADDLRGTRGFAYDPIFLIPELGKTFAEISDDQKNSMSHRGRALIEFSNKLEKYLKSH